MVITGEPPLRSNLCNLSIRDKSNALMALYVAFNGAPIPLRLMGFNGSLYGLHGEAESTIRQMSPKYRFEARRVAILFFGG